MAIDINQLIDTMKSTATAVINKDVTVLRGFSERQLEAIAKQTAFVASGITSGEITDATKDFFLDGIEDMVRSFSNTLRGLTAVTIEKVWNAIVGVIWDAIGKSAGIALHIPGIN
jgi:hypothetical protein